MLMDTEQDRVSVLVADDDDVTRRVLRHHLETAGYKVIESADGKDAIAKLNDDISVALFDLQMPGASGLECLRFARERHPEMQVLVISGQGEIKDAVAAMKQGASEYVTKPFDPDELLAHVAQAVRTARLARDNRGLREAVGSPQLAATYVARSPVSQTLLESVKKINVSHDASVLITGASGTGKTTLARLIHQAGPRAGKPFVAVSCGNLPRDLIEAELFGHERGAFTGAHAARPGRAEVADQGTLFLDEIGDLPLELQPKLLTFLQDRTLTRLGGNKVHKVDVRVIAATHRDLEGMCRDRLFREDLFFRLNVISLEVPRLAERREDIPELAKQFLAKLSQRRAGPVRVADDAMAALVAYDWPGNIRELENLLEQASVFCQDANIQLADLKFRGGIRPTVPAVSSAPSASGSGDAPRPLVGSLAGLTLDHVERMAIAETLKSCGGNRATAARMLGISERSVYNKIRQLGLEE